MRIRLIGPGRAGSALCLALGRLGWDVLSPLDRDDDPAPAAAGTDLLVISTPDGQVASVAGAVEPHPDTVVMHLAGSLGLDVLEPHPRRSALHPLMALPDTDTGADRLTQRGWFAVAGDPLAADIAGQLGGTSFTVADEHRASYHAAAVVASNHLVALMGQVERIAAGADVPFEAFLPLVLGTIDNVTALGPARALTGPASRGDDETIARHLAALDPDERSLYEALAAAARSLAP